MQMPHIIIVGGGAGGLELATQLGNTLGRSKKAKITLVDAKLTHVWKPLLHEIASGTLYAQDVELSYLAHANQHYFHFQLGKFDKLDRQTKTIEISPIYDEHEEIIIPRRALTYDYLVLALGSVSNDFGVKGVQEHCFFLDNQDQAEIFHKNFLTRWLNLISQPPNTKREFNIVIVGGGATGVELAGELSGMMQDIIKYSSYPHPDEKLLNISLVEAADRLVPVLPEALSKKVTKVLQHIGVSVYTNTAVKHVERHGVVTSSGLLPADMTVWAAGIKAPDLLCSLDGLAANNRCQLIVKPTLQTTKDDSIFAFGDCAACPVDDKSWVPPRAQSAHQQAMLLAESLPRAIEGKPLSHYHYRDYGSLVTISHNAVGNLMRILARDWMIEGAIAKWVYLSLYQKHLVALHGFWRTSIKTLSNLFSRKVKPKLKMH